VVAVLPLHASWLVDDIERLSAEIAAVEIPVALVIESGGDPLGVMAIVDGLLRLLLLDVPVIVLRADVSGLGVLCCGGYAAAVGLRDNLRRGPVRRVRPDPPAVLVPQLLRFIELERLDAAILADPESDLWRCDCEVCAGNELSWLGVTGGLHEAADAHAIASLLRLRDTALAAGAGSNLCQDQWARRCAGAIRRHAELADEPLVDHLVHPPADRAGAGGGQPATPALLNEVDAVAVGGGHHGSPVEVGLRQAVRLAGGAGGQQQRGGRECGERGGGDERGAPVARRRDHAADPHCRLRRDAGQLGPRPHGDGEPVRHWSPAAEQAVEVHVRQQLGHDDHAAAEDGHWLQHRAVPAELGRDLRCKAVGQRGQFDRRHRRRLSDHGRAAGRAAGGCSGRRRASQVVHFLTSHTRRVGWGRGR
jgi:hypothetical protein